MATELTPKGDLLPTNRDERLQLIDEVVAECNLQALDSSAAVTGSGLKQVLSLAAGVQKLRQLITADMIKDVMALQGTPLGYLTDKDRDGGYPTDVIKDVTIEAFMRGFRMVGNEVNVIAGRFYATKNGYARKLREFPGLTDLERAFSIPKNAGDKGAIVTAVATWKLNDRTQKLSRELAIKVNAGMGPDAILGKAQRKLDAAVYGQLTGSEQSDGDVDDVDVSKLRNVNSPQHPTDTSTASSASEILAQQLAANAPPVAFDLKADRAGALVTEINGMLRAIGGNMMKVLAEVAGQTNLKGLTEEQLQAIVVKLQALVKPAADATPANGGAPADDSGY